MNKHNALKITAFIVCTLIALVLSFSFMVKKEIPDVNNTMIKKEKAVFDETCMTRMQKDTLIKLMSIAYAGGISNKEDGDALLFTYTANDQSAPELYNGNEALTEFDLNDHGFEIKKNEKGLTLTLECRHATVPVPNDILIRLLSKYKTNLPKN